jgi:protein-tyrosine-phosphatase
MSITPNDQLPWTQQASDQLPSDQVPWDKDLLAEMDTDAREAREAEQFERDYAIAARAVERAGADAAGAHKRCPLKRCRRLRNCRGLTGCVVLRIDEPTEAQQEVIDQVYEQIQRHRQQAAIGEG